SWRKLSLNHARSASLFLFGKDNRFRLPLCRFFGEPHGLDAPDEHGGIGAGGNQVVAVACDGEGGAGIGGDESAELLGGEGVPAADRLVGAGREQALTVRGEDHSRAGSKSAAEKRSRSGCFGNRMGQDVQLLFSRRGIPQNDPAVATGGGQHISLRGES